MRAGKCLCGVVRYAVEASFLYAGYDSEPPRAPGTRSPICSRSTPGFLPLEALAT